MNTAKEALATYYRGEFRRADDCLDAITKVLEWNGPDSQKVIDILDLLVKHYQRDPMLK